MITSGFATQGIGFLRMQRIARGDQEFGEFDDGVARETFLLAPGVEHQFEGDLTGDVQKQLVGFGWAVSELLQDHVGRVGATGDAFQIVQLLLRRGGS